jgi:hypothetical protein
MIKVLTLASLVTFGVLATASHAQSCKALSTDQLAQLTSKGVTLKLGGEGEGYSGSLKLNKNGSAKGGATTDAGDKISIAGKWRIADNKFCRTWSDLNDGKEVCETWCLVSGSSVDVYNGNRKIGVNSW